MNRFWRAVMVVIDGPAHMRLRDDLKQACPECGHHLLTLHASERAGCGCTVPGCVWGRRA